MLRKSAKQRDGMGKSGRRPTMAMPSPMMAMATPMMAMATPKACTGMRLRASPEGCERRAPKACVSEAWMFTSNIRITEDHRPMVECDSAPHPEPPVADPLLQLVSLQKASGLWELSAALARVFGKTEDELANHRPAQVDGSVWATVLALIWLHTCRSHDQEEWQFVAMKAAAWTRAQKPDGLSQCVCDGNALLGGHVTEDALGI